MKAGIEKKLFFSRPDNLEKFWSISIGGEVEGTLRVLTEAEQNRLIVENMGLVEPVAAHYRGRKGIPFEDLIAAGRVGLVSAARKWEGWGNFVGFALKGINLAISHFVRDWQHLETVGTADFEELDKEFYEWQNFMATPYECWTELAATPDELSSLYDYLGTDRQALSSAMIGLSERERRMVYARFIREPYATFESIARDHKLSYARTVEIITRALTKMHDVIQAIGNKRETSLAAE